MINVKIKVNTITLKDQDSGKEEVVHTIRTVSELGVVIRDTEDEGAQSKMTALVNKAWNNYLKSVEF